MAVRRGESDYSLPVCGLLAVIVPAVVYFCSLDGSVRFWDTGEMQTVPYILGIAHPTSFPAFVLLGWLFSHAVLLGSVAWRLALFTSLAMMVACWALWATAVELCYSRWIAIGASWLFAFGYVAWTRGTRVEVHVLALAFESLAVFFAVKWRERGSTRVLLAGATSLGFALATHPVALWAVPGLALLALTGVRRITLRDAITSILAIAAPLSLYAYLPIRSAMLYAAHTDPTLTLGLPPGQPFWDYGHPANWQAFWWMVSGAQFNKYAAFAAAFDPLSYSIVLTKYFELSIRELGIVASIFAAAGIVRAFWRNIALGAGLLVVMFAGVPFALNYSIEADKERYLLLSFWCLCLFASIGAGGLLAIVARKNRALSAAGCAVLAAIAIVLLMQNRAIFAQRSDGDGQRYVDRVMGVTRPNAIIIAPWVYATPLGYAAYVEHSTADRIIVTADPGPPQRSWIARWSRSRPVYIASERDPAMPGICTRKIASGTPSIFAVRACESSAGPAKRHAMKLW